MKVDCDGRGEDPPPFLLLCRGGTHRAHTILSFRPLLSWSTNCFRITGEEEGGICMYIPASLDPPLISFRVSCRATVSIFLA